MKKSFYLLCLFMLQLYGIQAQKNIKLQIHHLLDGSNFELEKPSKNNLGHSFILTRMEYYLGAFILEHDGGKTTAIDSFWYLVNAEKETMIDLGKHNIQQLEKIHFHIGIDSAFNHRDPTLYPEDHPLALKEPSMHWGWTSGYRFLALEGWAGDQFNQLLQIHSLGDINYFKTSIAIIPNVTDNTLEIHLNADYVHILKDLSIKLGMIFHGENNAARRALQNMRDFVFKQRPASSATSSVSDPNNWVIYPNPVTDQELRFKKPFDFEMGMINIMDAGGRHRKSYFIGASDDTIEITDLDPGFYFVQLINQNGHTFTTKIVRSL